MKRVKILIDIPEELYQSQLSNEWTGNVCIREAIVNGTLLPKGHGDLIDREDGHSTYQRGARNNVE